MPKSSGQKLKLLYLMQLLLEQTDEDHPKSRAELCSMLQNNYQIEIERKTFYDDIESLRLYGLDIETTNERTVRYFIANRTFEMPELRLLTDAVQCSQFLSEKKTAGLIDKLTTLCSEPRGRELRHQVYISSRNKTVNEKIYYNIDAIYRAIESGKQLSFCYFNWSLSPQNQLVKKYRRENGRYLVSPFGVAWDDEKYYLIAYDKTAEDIRHYRIDKMDSIQTEDMPRERQDLLERFDSGAYVSKLFRMYGGAEEQITLRLTDDLLGVAVDQFGKSAYLRKDGEGYFKIICNVAVSDQFLGFLFSLGDRAELLEPESARLRFKEHLQKVSKKY